MVKVYIGMGGNLPSVAGSPAQTLAAATERLSELGQVTARSRYYSTAPVGFSGQPRFVNAVVELETKLAPHELLTRTMYIECEFGRERLKSFRNGPRTLDLDLLLYGDVVMAGNDLEIPHPRLRQRAFVLVPLVEIAPDLIDPRSHRTISELLDGLRARDEAGDVFLFEDPLPNP
ncbi:2-amino-4-hydroxy-6-hydroxymethyldihydropteridine diphosphokinase [Telmatobacter bradus]|uniref:2-amino-4-hydroxy-6- hydroxymethyldihydropteridine diphosphokinase n=1 Tax=Telmatobacter bradus TaxID=474953 RepID=UPI003B43B17D